MKPRHEAQCRAWRYMPVRRPRRGRSARLARCLARPFVCPWIPLECLGERSVDSMSATRSVRRQVLSRCRRLKHDGTLVRASRSGLADVDLARFPGRTRTLGCSGTNPEQPFIATVHGSNEEGGLLTAPFLVNVTEPLGGAFAWPCRTSAPAELRPACHPHWCWRAPWWLAPCPVGSCRPSAGRREFGPHLASFRSW
jgi:hypothetical protein